MGIDGWLYRPGDLTDMRMRVADLVGDTRKRRAFAEAGHTSVQTRSWAGVCDQLLGHYDAAIALRTVDGAARARRVVRPEPAAPAAQRRWQRYVALGDSLTEGLCDPAPDGALRGWVDRLALLLAARGSLHYANLAIRSKRVDDVPALAARLEGAVVQLRAADADVVLVTPFLPGRRAAALYTRRFSAFATALAGIAARTGAILIDTDLHTALPERSNWRAGVGGARRAPTRRSADQRRAHRAAEGSLRRGNARQPPRHPPCSC